MSKINCLSPYYVTRTVSSGVTSVELDIWIYTGVRHDSAPSEPTYKLKSTVINGEVVFDISLLIKDYFDFRFNGDYINDNVWVDIRTNECTDTQCFEGSTVNKEAYYGYGFHNIISNPSEPLQGQNPQMERMVRRSTRKILIPEGEYVNIPYDNIRGTSLVLGIVYNDNTAGSVQGDDVSNITTPSGIVKYFSDTNVKTIVANDNPDAETYSVDTICPTKYKPHKITFINMYGALEDLWFFGNTKTESSIESENFRRNIVNSGIYNVNEHQYVTMKKNSRETITLNSGFYPEECNEAFNQLILSDRVWITVAGQEFPYPTNPQVLPVQLKDSSFVYKTRLTDRVINYTMQFEFAFDKINTVR